MAQNDGDVKIVVGNNFDDIVLDESKDVLLEVCHCNPRNKIHKSIGISFFVRTQFNVRCVIQIYAPWCGHCQALEPTYNKLAKHLRGIESLVIAKMDGTTNEHPRAKVIQNSNMPQLIEIHN